MDPARENNRLRARNAAIKKEFDALRADHGAIKEENQAAKLVLEYLRTYNLPSQKRPSSGQGSSALADDSQQISHASTGYGTLRVLSDRTPSSDFTDEAIMREQTQR